MQLRRPAELLLILNLLNLYPIRLGGARHLPGIAGIPPPNPANYWTLHRIRPGPNL